MNTKSAVITIAIALVLNVNLLAQTTAPYRIATKTTLENAGSLRAEGAAFATHMQCNTLQDRIMCRLLEAWGTWKPGYEGWLDWSNGLYAEDAVIAAIGETDQDFRDYQQSMKLQRDKFQMEMGPIIQIIVDGNLAALVYDMFLLSKDKGELIQKIKVTEFNAFEEKDGKRMVTRLDLYTS